MVTYCNLFSERNALLAAIHQQAILIDQHPAKEPCTFINHCEQIHRELEQLEQEEDSRDRQASFQPPMHPLQDHRRRKQDHSGHYHGLGNLCFAFSNLALGESGFDFDFASDSDSEFADEIECFSYYCGDDGHDADSDYFHDGHDEDGDDCDGDDCDGESDGCLNCHLQERICGRRDCDSFGFCRIIEHGASFACVCHDD